MVAVGIEVVAFEEGSGGEDAGELPLDELARHGGFDLFADSDLFALEEELVDVGLGGMVGDAGHGHLVPFGEGNSEEAGPFLGVLVENLIKIAKAEKEEGIGGQLIPESVPLLHHGGGFLLCLGHERGDQSRSARGASRQELTGLEKGGGKSNLLRACGCAPVEKDYLNGVRGFIRTVSRGGR